MEDPLGEGGWARSGGCGIAYRPWCRTAAGPAPGADRMIRGGYWYGDLDGARAAARAWTRPDYLGFQLARSL